LPTTPSIPVPAFATGSSTARRTRYFIEDDGPGLDGARQDIADLFSIARPLRSSKLLRLPQRGQLGNGLRVVAGAVLASSGTLSVAARTRRTLVVPSDSGWSVMCAGDLWPPPVRLDSDELSLIQRITGDR
jgi:hypothetical protein